VIGRERFFNEYGCVGTCRSFGNTEPCPAKHR
jgi:hypothetical protein